MFENSYGDGDLVRAQELDEFIQNSSKKFSLVFVAACDSELVGKIFRLNNADHVVCVEKDRFVLDKAAILFTKIFYEQLFKYEQRVCAAFDQAKRSVKMRYSAEEASLFKIFANHSKAEPCSLLKAFDEGKWQCMSQHTKIKCIPTKL